MLINGDLIYNYLKQIITNLYLKTSYFKTSEVTLHIINNYVLVEFSVLMLCVPVRNTAKYDSQLLDVFIVTNDNPA